MWSSLPTCGVGGSTSPRLARRLRLVGCLAAVGLASGTVADKRKECASWAAKGECSKNPDFMAAECAASCAANPQNALGEPEQCAGWADQGECTRNPKYMMGECPESCKQQRAKMHEGMLDERMDCMDAATVESCKGGGSTLFRGRGLRQECAGSCLTADLCDAEADPRECAKALRCRELKDEWSDCASRVKEHGCEAERHARTLLKHCYLSCARVDLGGLLRRFRLKYTVRTRRYGLLDEEGGLGRAAGAPTLPCTCRHTPCM